MPRAYVKYGNIALIEATAFDRRAKELHLTKAGEKRLQVARKGWSQAQARFETTFRSEARGRPAQNTPGGRRKRICACRRRWR
jgi:hypothetical protein